MNKISILLVLILATISPASIYAEDKSATDKDNTRVLTEDELESKIGRFGEAEEVPEDFEFNSAEVKLWMTDHFSSVTEPVSMYYEFERSGSYDPGFVDSVYLKVKKLNEDGTKNVQLDFLTGEKKQVVRPENVTEITGNPILGIFLQGDVQNMQQLTEGHYRHFIKMIKVALREVATVEPVTFSFDGKDYSGEKITFSPYLNDTHRTEYERFAVKTYEFIFAEKLPGQLYQIKTTIPDIADPDAKKPLIQETVTLKGIKAYKS